MKKILSFLLIGVVVIASFAGCDSKNRLAGTTWVYAESSDKYTGICFSENGSEFYFWDINFSGEYLLHTDPEDSYTVKGYKVTLHTLGGEQDVTYKFKIEGNTLSLSYEGQELPQRTRLDMTPQEYVKSLQSQRTGSSD